jgi:hypothetical protein
MKEKIMAALMASIMVVVALSAALVPSSDADNEPPAIGTIGNPQYIIGSADEPYVIGTNGVEAKLSMNVKAFDVPKSSATFYLNTTSTMTDDASKATTTGCSFTKDDTNGVHTINFTNAAAAGYYLIAVKLTDDISSPYNSVDLYYYYAANISKTSATVVLTQTQSEQTEEVTSIEFKKDTNFTGTFAKVKVVNGSTDTFLGADKYDFYETNLPNGIAMKTNGEIAGKIISSAPLATDQAFTVYAVNKVTGQIILASTDLKYSVTEDSSDSDSFKYKIGADGTATLYSTPGYSAIKNSDTLVVELLNYNGTSIASIPTGDDAYTFAAKYSAGGSFTIINPVTAEGKTTVTLPALGDYTGIVQLQITKTKAGETFTATIHVMLVGPLVHSGLAPAVTSA